MPPFADVLQSMDISPTKGALMAWKMSEADIKAVEAVVAAYLDYDDSRPFILQKVSTVRSLGVSVPNRKYKENNVRKAACRRVRASIMVPSPIKLGLTSPDAIRDYWRARA